MGDAAANAILQDYDFNRVWIPSNPAPPAPHHPSSAQSQVCRNCGSPNLHEIENCLMCVDCNTVVDENQLVNAVEFQETEGGGVQTQGQFVSAVMILPPVAPAQPPPEQAVPPSDLGLADPASSSSAIGRADSTVVAAAERESQNEQTQKHMKNAKMKLVELAGRLSPPAGPTVVARAQRVYLNAYSKGFVRGRRQEYVLACALYAACRAERLPYLITDFLGSDLNPFVMSSTFLLMCQVVGGGDVGVVDPALYVDRFAQKLELGSKTSEVATTALRIVARMKRDWIQQGRRPTGVCGAALLVASRLHGFDRDLTHVRNVVDVTEPTLRLRLSEFSSTPSGNLSIDEFFALDLLEEQDPPSFAKGVARWEKYQHVLETGEVDLEQAVRESDALLKGFESFKPSKSEEEEEDEGFFPVSRQTDAQKRAEKRREREAQLSRELEEELLSVIKPSAGGSDDALSATPGILRLSKAETVINVPPKSRAAELKLLPHQKLYAFDPSEDADEACERRRRAGKLFQDVLSLEMYDDDPEVRTCLLPLGDAQRKAALFERANRRFMEAKHGVSSGQAGGEEEDEEGGKRSLVLASTKSESGRLLARHEKKSKKSGKDEEESEEEDDEMGLLGRGAKRRKLAALKRATPPPSRVNTTKSRAKLTRFRVDDEEDEE